MKFKNSICGLIAGLLLLCGASQATAQITTIPSGLNPGDSYRLIFVTSDIGNATSSDISVYDALVTSQAAQSPELVSLGTTWQVVASTSSVDARVHTNTDFTVNTGVAIFNLGDAKVADNNADLWDGSLDAGVSLDQFGNGPRPHPAWVWGGTVISGLKKGGFTLGPGNKMLGFANVSTGHWIDRGIPSNDITGFSGAQFYALSGILTVPPSNTPPTANAGADQSIRAGDTVDLDGSGSFDDNTAQALLDYQWSFDTAPLGSAATLDDDTSVMPSFVADVAGTYVLQLIVTDEGELSSDPAYVVISSDNLAPTAVVTADFSLIIIGDVIQLDGTGSTDPETDELTYSWTITSAPATSTAIIVGDDTVNPTFAPDVEGFTW